MQPGASAEHLPIIYIELSQPGDRGSFMIRAVDATTQKVISQNTLPEHISDVQYLYTARLLEHGSSKVAGAPDVKDDAWKKTDRYKDMARYGQKLYTDLFGEKGDLRNYVRRAAHLKDEVQYVLKLYNTASELWNIPWEYLHDGERFLAVDSHAAIVRTTPDIVLDRTAQQLSETPYPLRILLFISDPKGVNPLNIDYEVQTIRSALQPAIDAHQVELDIVEEGSLNNLDLNLSYESYHVLYYTGHGAMTPQGGVLVIEDDEGAVELANLTKISEVLRKAGSLRLVVLSACQSGQIDETKAASGIATGLLQVVPAVVAMQFSILDISARVFASTFFQLAGQGATLEVAMQRARSAMNQASPALADWGVPALYVHNLGMRLIDPQRPTEPGSPAKTIQIDPLPRPPLFVGRRDEQRKLRQRLPYLNFNMIYLWGMAGIGKSALAARILERPGRKDILDSALVIPCKQTTPAQILTRLADWLEGSFPEAAKALRHPQLSPDRRVMMAAQIVQRRRMVLVFDRFDAYLTPGEDRVHWEIENPLLAGFFHAIATAPWSILTIFTSRYRWKLLNTLDENRCDEIHLDQLAPWEAGMLIQGLEHLKKLDPEPLGEIMNQVGGHPSTIYGLESQAAKERERLAASTSRVAQMLSQGWGASFMNEVVGRLVPAEREVLLRLSVLESAFWTDDVQFSAGVPTRQEAEQMIVHWEALSLAHFVYHDPETEAVCYGMPHLVRTFMLTHCPPEQMKDLHRKASMLLERKFAVMAEERWRAGIGPEPPQGDPFDKARAELRLVLQKGSHEVITVFVNRALSWRKHLVQVGEHEKAAKIVNDVWLVIKQRYGEPDLARKLLEETIQTTTGRTQYLAQINYANFLTDDGEFDDALTRLQDSHRRALKDNDLFNAGVALGLQFTIYSRQSKLDKAIKVAEQNRDLCKKSGDLVGEAGALLDIAICFHQKEKPAEALKMLAIAEALLRERRDKDAARELMEIIHRKGMILRQDGKFGPAIECFQTAYDMAQQLGSLSNIGRALGEMGTVLRQVGRLGDAGRFTLESISVAEQLKDNVSLANRLHSLALIYERQGSANDALIQAERALALAKAHNPAAVEVIRDTVTRLRKKR
jgi:tetratricopeptide (TPR) repeat protein